MKWIQSRFDTCSAQRFINSSNLYLLTTQQKIRYWPVESGHYLKRIPHACQLAISSGEYLEAPGPYKALQARSNTTGGTLARSKRRTCCRCEGKRITQLLPSLVSFGWLNSLAFQIFRDEYKTVQNFKVQIRPKMSCSICFPHFDQCKRSRSSVCPFFWAVGATLEST